MKNKYHISPGRSGEPVLHDGKNYPIAEVYDEERVKLLLSKLEIALEALEQIYDCGSRRQSEIISNETLSKILGEDWSGQD